VQLENELYKLMLSIYKLPDLTNQKRKSSILDWPEHLNSSKYFLHIKLRHILNML